VVVDVLRSEWLTTGPKVAEFEKRFAEFLGIKEAVAVSNGTAALHTALNAIGISSGDEVILSPMTFVATANAVLFQGGTPVFADVDEETLLIDCEEVRKKITPKTKAILSVDYAGQPCDYHVLNDIAKRHGLMLVADACHALGAKYEGKNVGTLADLSVFSFHPVKHITTGEGGMIVTDMAELAKKMQAFRNHGISMDHNRRAEKGTWYYEMNGLGYNYRITDFQCALGLNQLQKLSGWIKRRQEIAARYDLAFKDLPSITPLCVNKNTEHAYHLYIVKLDLKMLKASRGQIFSAFRERGVGVNVHYIPVYLHPYYRDILGYKKGECPVAENVYESMLSLPMFHGMTDNAIEHVVGTARSIIDAYLIK
jgi:perosamine synthetase